MRKPPHGNGLILYGSKPGAACPATGHGRPSNAAKALFEELATLPEAEKTLRAILRGEQAVALPGGLMLVDGRLFLETHKHVCDRAWGKPAPDPTAGGGKRLVFRLVEMKAG